MLGFFSFLGFFRMEFEFFHGMKVPEKATCTSKNATQRNMSCIYVVRDKKNLNDLVILTLGFSSDIVFFSQILHRKLTG